MILVNGTSGIGTGYSTNVIQFNPLEIVDRLKKIISDGDYDELTPYYRGFSGKITKESDQHYIVDGIYKVINDDTVRITEIPISLRPMSFEKYKEYLTSVTILDKKEDSNKKKIGLLWRNCY
jgi:DNA topoisomerase-2